MTLPPPTLLKQPCASQTFQRRERIVLFTRARRSSPEHTSLTVQGKCKKRPRSAWWLPGSRQRGVKEASENTMQAPALFQKREGSVKSGSVREVSEERAKGRPCSRRVKEA